MKVYIVIERCGDGYGHGGQEIVDVFLCEHLAEKCASEVQETHRNRVVEEKEVNLGCKECK